MRIKLVTPERVLFEEEIASATLPTEAGEITVLEHHIPIVSNLMPGVAEITFKSGSVEDVALSGGCIQVGDEGNITILADTAERGEELDIDVIEKAKAAAEKLMNEQTSVNDEQFAEAAAMLERELARYKAANKYRQRKGIRTGSR